MTRRRFFLAACDVPSLEEKFNVDQYSDLVTVTKPVIYISIGEIINTHTVSRQHTPAPVDTPPEEAGLDLTCSSSPQTNQNTHLIISCVARGCSNVAKSANAITSAIKMGSLLLDGCDAEPSWCL